MLFGVLVRPTRLLRSIALVRGELPVKRSRGAEGAAVLVRGREAGAAVPALLRGRLAVLLIAELPPFTVL